jgi:hypothetical protein
MQRGASTVGGAVMMCSLSRVGGKLAEFSSHYLCTFFVDPSRVYFLQQANHL